MRVKLDYHGNSDYSRMTVKFRWFRTWGSIYGKRKWLVWFHENPAKISRDICTIRGETMEFVSRGHGYGSVDHIDGDNKENFIKLCEEMRVEWLDESGEKHE